MPIVFDPKVDPIYKKGVEQGIKKAKLEDAKSLMENLHLPIENISRILNIPLEELKKYLNQK